MANYALSQLVKAQIVVQDKFVTPEIRAIKPSVVKLALGNVGQAMSQAEQARIHENRVADILYFTKKAAGSATAKVSRHTGSDGDSAKANLTYVTHTETFSHSYKMSNNNAFDNATILAYKLKQAWDNLLARHEQSAVDFLNTNRCQLTAANLATPISASGAGTWNDTNKVLEIASANKNFRFAKAESFLNARYYTDGYDAVADLQTITDLNYLINQGQGNATNLSYQFGNTGFVASQKQLDTNYTGGAFYIMPKAGFAGVCWNDKLNRDNVYKGDYIGTFTTMADPYGIGAMADVSIYADRADTSADTVGGSVQDVKEQYEISLTIAYAASPLTTANDSVIHKVVIA